MDIISLRKLTKKSTIDFGKHTGARVDYLLQEDKGYLIWLYYCSQRITFVDEVLDELEIYPEFRIEKPGVNKQRMYELQREKRDRYINEADTEEEKNNRTFSVVNHIRSINKRNNMRRLIATERAIEWASRKCVLESWNHGHR